MSEELKLVMIEERDFLDLLAAVDKTLKCKNQHSHKNPSGEASCHICNLRAARKKFDTEWETVVLSPQDWGTPDESH